MNHIIHISKSFWRKACQWETLSVPHQTGQRGLACCYLVVSGGNLLKEDPYNKKKKCPDIYSWLLCGSKWCLKNYSKKCTGWLFRKTYLKIFLCIYLHCARACCRCKWMPDTQATSYVWSTWVAWGLNAGQQALQTNSLNQWAIFPSLKSINHTSYVTVFIAIYILSKS